MALIVVIWVAWRAYKTRWWDLNAEIYKSNEGRIDVTHTCTRDTMEKAHRREEGSGAVFILRKRQKRLWMYN